MNIVCLDLEGVLAYMVKFEKPPNGGFFHGLMSFGTCGIGF